MNIKRALISVSDKTGIVEFAKKLSERGVDIISTGGTASLFQKEGIPVKQVSEVTGFPEILGGRVKTLHPKIFGGILVDLSNKRHVKDLQDNLIESIDMVVVNLYPFDEVQKRTRDEDTLIENIDIGGVALLRASAKNHRNVVVVCDPTDYDKIISSIDLCGDVPLHDRRILALKAFYYTMKYDSTIHKVLSELFASEKFEHMTFEKFAIPQSKYEILDKVGERFLTLSKHTPYSLGILTGAIALYINPKLAVSLTGNLPSKIVNLEKSGGRICDLTGESVVIKDLTLDMARKLRESVFKTIAYNTVEDEFEVKEILKDRELIHYTYEHKNTLVDSYTGNYDNNAKNSIKISSSTSVENILLKRIVEIKQNSMHTDEVLEFIMSILPKYAIALEDEAGYITVNLDLHNPLTCLEKCLENVPVKANSLITNFEPDGMFKKVCQENEIEEIKTFVVW